MEEITSLIITFIGNDTWTFKDNTMPPGGDRGNDAYSGTWDLNLYTFKSKTGAIIYDRIPINVIQYVDEIIPANSFNPTTCRQLHTYLKSVDFFDDSNNGGGSTDIALQDLSNALFSNLFGRGGQMVIIDESEEGFTTSDYTPIVNIEDLANVPPIIAGYVLMGAGLNQTRWVSLNQLQLPPLQFKQQRLKSKGYIWNLAGTSIVPNTQNLIQVGDIIEGFVTDGDPEDNTSTWYWMDSGRYEGEDGRLLSSYVTSSYKKLAFESEPNF